MIKLLVKKVMSSLLIKVTLFIISLTIFVTFVTTFIAFYNQNKIFKQLSLDPNVVLGFQKDLIIYSVVSGIFLVVIAGVASAVWGKITWRPLLKVVQSMNEIAKGDFTKKVQVESSDEIGQLEQAYNQITDNMRLLIGDLINTTQKFTLMSSELSKNAEESNQVTNQVATAIEEVSKGNVEQTQSINDTAILINQLSEGIKQIASGAGEQLSHVNEASTVVGNMANAIENVVQSTGAVSEAAEQTAVAAQNGASAVEKTILGMENIKIKVFETAGRIKDLAVHSEQIGEIIELIDGISEQTNLLALNAAIEAARAGENGKGFAVVADEVRKLAERSSKATKEIAEIIINIKNDTEKAIKAMEEGTHEVEEGSTLANGAGQKLQDILRNLDITYTQIQNISQATQQISEGSAGVVSAIDNVAGVTEENSAATNEMSTGSVNATNVVNNIANVATETAAAAEEVLASTKELAHSSEVFIASAQSLQEMAMELDSLIQRFKI